MADLIDTASLRKFLDADVRARRIVDMAVAQAMAYAREPETAHDTKRIAYETAQLATAALLKFIYEDDAEIAALRHERDAYKEKALWFANSMAPTVMVKP
jgi:hypothetical protein